MTPDELREEISIEFEYLESILAELGSLRNDLTGRAPSVREKTAAGAFLAQFYGGIENILKRICCFYSVPLPRSEIWHIELFQMFSAAAKNPPLPVLFEDELSGKLGPFRKFRHIVYHGYGFQLDWDRMLEGISQIDEVFLRIKNSLNAFLRQLP